MAGVCRLGDRAKAPVDVHGCPSCPHPNVIGPSISASSNVYVNGAPALRIADIGMHMTCCGTNMWKIIGASGQVFINGSQMVRKGDPTQHCGGIGQMMEASGNVSDGSPLTTPGAFGGLPQLPPLPPNQVLVFPDMEPMCSPNAPPGLPTSGGPQIYDQNAAARNLPHAEPGPTPEEAADGMRRVAAGNWIAGNQEGYDDAMARVEELEGESDFQKAKEALEAVLNSVGKDARAKQKAREALEKLERDRRASQQSGRRSVRVPRTPRVGR